jgi:hypothetical protein
MRSLFHHIRSPRKRSYSAKRDFLKMRGYRRVPKGFQVEHRVPLFAGGSDSPSNMQLMSTFAHRSKTRADYRMYRRR